MKQPHPCMLSVLALLPLAACDVGQGEVRAKNRFNNCAPCHGADGSGNRSLEAPAIAGLPVWYVEAQLRKFQSGARGAHADDIAGLRMRPMARTLDAGEDVKAVADHVAKLTPAAARLVPTVTGDPARGRTLYATCVACHGERGAGNQALNAPDLHHQGDWYLLAQLKKFKQGIRGMGPGDVTGAQMRPMAATLADEQAMRDVVSYINTLAQ